MEKLLEVRNLTVEIGKKHVIDNVNLSLYRGKTTAIVGESGSGKTMTALSVLDLLPAAARIIRGEVIFHGENLLGMPREKIRRIRGGKIAMVFQEPFTALDPVMRAGEQILETLLAHDVKGKDNGKSRVEELLSSVKLPPGVYGRYPHELSGGMRQRVMIAMALSCGPEVLILDEPTTALDVTMQKDILDMVKNIQAEKELGIIFITHDLSVVNILSNHVYVMKNGKIVEEGPQANIFKVAEHPYTRHLFDCIPRLGDKRKRLPEE